LGTYDRLFNILQEADMPTTTQAKAAVSENEAAYTKAISEWNTVIKTVTNLNSQLKKSGLPQLKM
jgi:hypothetical protein